MIVSKLQGGLGNQIFQWAYGLSLSLKNNTDHFLDIGFYGNQNGVTPREYSLNRFPNMPIKIFGGFEKNSIRIHDSFHFSELNYDHNLDYYLDGYWQSEKYFIDFSSIIKERLSPDNDVYDKLKKLISKNSISIHVRRTDYLSSNGFHPVQEIDYYKRSLEEIGNYDNVYIFSDDINWCKQNLNFSNSNYVDGFSDLESIWMMSMCDHNVIANSSFSWWGAWMNNNPNKIVIAPQKWFGSHANLNTSDIVPKNWKLM